MVVGNGVTIAGCMAALERARAALDAHYRVCDQRFNGRFNDLGVEARRRLTQMIWLLSEIGKLLAISERAQAKLRDLGALLETHQITREEWQAKMQSPEFSKVVTESASVGDALETLTEAFYWIGGRARGVIRELPMLRGFEAKGLRNTRNKLLEHPGGNDSGVIWGGFAWGADIGPVIKGLRYAHQSDIWPDKGLFANATELADELDRKATRAIEDIRD